MYNLFQNQSKKNVENSEIGPDSETLTSNVREPVDLSFNRLSFIQGVGGCGDEVHYENGGKGRKGKGTKGKEREGNKREGRPSFSIIEKIMTIFFLLRFW